MKKSWRMIFAVVLCMLCLAPLALAEDGKTFVLPAKLKTVQAEAFAGDARVTKVVIPKTVNTIGARAFANCAGLREVYFENNPSLKIADDAFAGCGDICFYAYPDTPGEQFALSHGYQCEPLGSGSSFMERSLLLMSQHGGTTSILQSGEFDSKRLVVRMVNGRLPDVSAYKPVKILRKEDGIYFVQFDTVENTANCYGYLKNLQKASADVAFVECDSCVRAIDDVEAAGTVDSGVWDTEDPMGFDAYAPYVADNSSGKVVIAIIDSGVKKLAAYSGMLRSDGVNLVTDGKDWSADSLVHGSMIAGIIHDCVGSNNVEILPIRVIADSNVVDCSMIALAIDYAVERGADIINLSMNFDENEYVRYAIGKAIDAGVRVIVAAGNNNQNIDKVFPANVPGVIAVSGIDSQYTKSSSSNYGGNVTYCAPDTAIKSTAYPSMTRKGTSFAAPMVVSALALAKLDSTHSESDIKTVCEQLTPVVNGVNNYGNGLIRLNQLISEGYTISYDANGGDNAPETQIKTPGISIILTEEKPTRHYKVTLNHGTGQIEEMSVNAPFIDWNTKANGSGTSYASGAKYKEDVAIKLYAQWDGAALTGLPTPTRTGYSFVGWYTASSGGNPVNAQTEITRNVNLYARWKELSAYTVAYDANGGTGAPESQIKYEGITLTLSATKPTRKHTVTLDYGTGKKETRTISATFKNWNTKVDGKGTSYASGANYTADAAVTLYAQWTYGTLGELPTPTRDGYTFAGWFNAATGGNAVNANTAVSGNMTIYARWTVGPYTVSYDANGAENAPESQTKIYGVDLTLTTDEPSAGMWFNRGIKTESVDRVIIVGGTPILSRTLRNISFSEYMTRTFLGWSDQKIERTGSMDIVKYLPGQLYTYNASITLYAVWGPLETTKFTVAYSSVNCNDWPEDTIKEKDVDLIISTQIPTRDNYSVYFNDGMDNTTTQKVAYRFAGWNTKADGTGDTYQSGSVFRENSMTLFYSQWEYGTLSTFPNPSRNGYAFDGWYTEAEGGERVMDGTALTPGMTLYAHWKGYPAAVYGNVE